MVVKIPSSPTPNSRQRTQLEQLNINTISPIITPNIYISALNLTNEISFPVGEQWRALYPPRRDKTRRRYILDNYRGNEEDPASFLINR